jgi:site-specific DNA-cytosine methylase
VSAIYSDNDRHAAAWLRELVKDGHLPQGMVNERDIRDLRASDLQSYRQVHLFAGIGGWAYALHLAGWPATRPVWTASCPCQPFSSAGKRKAGCDDRHLWPHLFRLVGECRPATLFGEQVSSKLGYRWLARVRDDLEKAGYAVGCADLPACSQGAPHIRNRLFLVADRGRVGWQTRPQDDGEATDAKAWAAADSELCRSAGGLADATSRRDQNQRVGVESTGQYVGVVTASGIEPREASLLRPEMKERLGLAGWATPTERDYRHPNAKSLADRGGGKKGEQLANQVVHSGPTADSSSAETSMNTAGTASVACLLNPRFSLWLQGYPDVWASCAERAIASCRKLRRRS